MCYLLDQMELSLDSHFAYRHMHNKIASDDKLSGDRYKC